MTPIPVYIVPRRQVESLTSTPPIPQADLDNYLSLRPEILSDGKTDIFCQNCRSAVQAHTAFELWNRVDRVEPGTAVVFPFWMELFYSFGRRDCIRRCIDWLKSEYPRNPCVIQWNHDADAATVPELQGLPDNFFVLQFNTSKPTTNDILLPFWAIETRQQWTSSEDRPIRGGFIGYVGGVEVRQKMRYGFAGRRGWEIMATEREGKLLQEEYLRRMQQWDFALCPRGGGLGSYRFYEALQNGCVPILFADDAALPYPGLQWGDLIVRLPEADADNFRVVTDILSHMDVKLRRQRIAEVRERFGLAGVQRVIYERLKEYMA